MEKIRISGAKKTFSWRFKTPHARNGQKRLSAKCAQNSEGSAKTRRLLGVKIV
jgi:hypothetical protein